MQRSLFALTTLELSEHRRAFKEMVGIDEKQTRKKKPRPKARLEYKPRWRGLPQA